MTRTARGVSLLLAVLLALAGGAASAQSNAWGWGNLTGSWRIQVTIPPGASVCPAESPEPCVIAAMSTATADGTVVQTAAIPGVSTGHGAWVHDGGRRYRVESTYFRFGPDGSLLGTSVTVTRMELDQYSRHAVGDFSNTVFDLAGNAVGSFSGSATADKILP
jgi:hypothetical protein